MADILIRGFEMPTDASLWLLIRPDGTVHKLKVCGKHGEPQQGVAVPLTEGHGRLIDADALIENHFSDEHRIALSPANKLWMRRIIKGEPTIIEAEGGTDDDGNA